MRLTALSIAAFVVVAALWFGSGDSADLTAVWLAGEFLADGRPDLVYPADTTVFTMLPPPEWFERMRGRGVEGDIFPFLYPPIWAAIAAGLSRVTTLEAILDAAHLVNAALLAGTAILACRIARPRIGPLAWTATALVFLMVTSIGLIAMFQNQPQILVAFLTILAIERCERGSPIAAGAALALAAAVKGFPAVFALVWLLSGQRRAAAAFLVAGFALGLLSVAVAGWPLHAEFLRIARVISGTAMGTNLSYALDGLIGQAFLRDTAVFVQSPARDPALGAFAGWSVIPKPAALSAALLAAQAGVILLAGRALGRTADPGVRAAVWASALTALTFLGPVGWSYYYIAPAAFIPLLIDRFGAARGLALILALALPISPLVTLAGIPLADLPRLPQALGCITVAAMGLIFLHLARTAPART
jgi:hypothetical protein